MTATHSEPLQLPSDAPLPHELFEMLQTIAALTGENEYPPTLSEVAEAYGCTRQWVHEAVGKLRAAGLIEEPRYQRETRGTRLTHNGKLLLETTLDAGIKE